MENCITKDMKKDRMIVAWNLDGTLHRLYDGFAQLGTEFPLITEKAIPCVYMGKEIEWFDDLAPVEKLRVVALDDIKSKCDCHA